MTILDRIVEEKKRDLKYRGISMGVKVPDQRKVPLIPLARSPMIICEIKRSSPSRGLIKTVIDPVKQAAEYIKRGIKSISIITEERYFSGSLRDLLLVKRAYPGISILRKDFIVSEEEIDISYRAGADAILLIASIHSINTLYKLYNKAKKYGMDVLFEVHSEEDIKKARYINPEIVGINSRNLEDFTIDLFHPLQLKKLISWKAKTVFESGIKNREDALFALSSGFEGILIGEAVVKDPSLAESIRKIYKNGISNFWEKLFKNDTRPLIKICGITNTKDVNYLESKEIDAMGFVFAPSPRMATSNLLKELKEINISKVGVITPESLKNKELKKETEKIIKEKLVDALQLHGFPPTFKLNPEFSIPYYNAVRIKDVRDLQFLNEINSPRILIDAFDSQKVGGTGKSLPDETIYEARKITPLWIAGGIGADNVKNIINKFKPELVDASSSLEKSAGIKDHDKIDRFFEEIKNAKTIQ